jgi:type II secretory pathway component PulJ
MGFDDNQYLLIKHQDTSHKHVHLVTNRVKINGECVSQRFDYRRSEELVRQLEQRYSLEPTPPS